MIPTRIIQIKALVLSTLIISMVFLTVFPGDASAEYTSPRVYIPPELNEIVNISSPSSTRYYGFPCTVELDNGTLLCVYRNGTAHISASTIEYKYSYDKGLTWYLGGNIAPTDPAHDLRDPKIHMMPNGQVYVFCGNYHYGTSTYTNSEINKWHYIDGSWVDDGDINITNIGAYMPILCTQIINVGSVSYMVGETWDSSVDSFVMKSTNNGLNWTILTVFTTGSVGESAITHLGDSTLLVLLSGSAYVYKSISYDLGDSWSALADFSTPSMGGTLWSAHNLNWINDYLIFSGRDRENISVSMMVSHDNGATFIDHETIKDYGSTIGNGGYCTGLSLNDTTLFVTYYATVDGSDSYPDVYGVFINSDAFEWDDYMADITATDGDTYAYDFNTSLNSTFGLVTDAEWLSINPTSGEISGIAETGAYYVNVTATYEGLLIHHNYSLLVSTQEESPGIDMIAFDGLNGLIEMIIAAMLLMAMVSMIGLVKVKKR